MDTSNALTLVGIILTILTLEGGAIAWIYGQSTKVRTEGRKDIEGLRDGLEKDIEALAQKESLDIGALRIETNTRIDGVEQRESKARHDLANRTQENVLTLQTQINQIRDGGATKSELSAVETRLTAALTDLKNDTRAELSKIAGKLDQLPAISSQVTALVSAVEKMGDHLMAQQRNVP